MAEILHHLGCIKPYKQWDKLPTSTGERRISAINSRMSCELAVSFKECQMPNFKISLPSYMGIIIKTIKYGSLLTNQDSMETKGPGFFCFPHFQ